MGRVRRGVWVVTYRGMFSSLSERCTGNLGQSMGAQSLTATYLYRFQVSQHEVYLPGTAVVCHIVLWTDHKEDNQGNFDLLRSFRSLR